MVEDYHLPTIYFLGMEDIWNFLFGQQISHNQSVCKMLSGSFCYFCYLRISVPSPLIRVVQQLWVHPYLNLFSAWHMFVIVDGGWKVCYVWHIRSSFDKFPVLAILSILLLYAVSDTGYPFHYRIYLSSCYRRTFFPFSFLCSVSLERSERDKWDHLSLSEDERKKRSVSYFYRMQ